MQRDLMFTLDEPVVEAASALLSRWREFSAAWPRLRDWLLAWPLPLAVLALWALAARFEWIAPQVLPSPEAVALTFKESLLSGELWANLQISLLRVLGGFAVGLVGAWRSASRWACRRP